MCQLKLLNFFLRLSKNLNSNQKNAVNVMFSYIYFDTDSRCEKGFRHGAPWSAGIYGLGIHVDSRAPNRKDILLRKNHF